MTDLERLNNGERVPLGVWDGPAPDVADALRPALPVLVDEIVAVVSSEVPDYRRSLSGAFARGVRAGVDQALSGFVELVHSGDESLLPGREVYIRLGRGEHREGRSLDALLAAYRVGARVAWRRFAEAGEAAGLPSPRLYRLAEAIFAYIDELSSASVEGYARAQSVAAGELQNRRRRLVELLLADPPAPRPEFEEAARAAAWRLPATLAVIAFELESVERVVPRLPPETLVAPGTGIGIAVLPDPRAPGRPAVLERAFEGVRAALGPEVSWPSARRSADRARLAMALVPDSPDGGVLAADERLLDLLLIRDLALTADLVRRRLAPLEELPEPTRDRLRETLEAWLAHQGEARPIADALHVHVQTVRYRVSQLRELVPEVFDDPSQRLELELALRASSLAARGGGSAG